MVRIIDKHGLDVLRENETKPILNQKKTAVIHVINGKSMCYAKKTYKSKMNETIYYYTLSKTDKDEKNKKIIDKIKEIFIYHQY